MTRSFNPLHFTDPGIGTRDISLRSEADRPARPILVSGTKRGIEYSRGTSDSAIGSIQYLHDNYKTSASTGNEVAWFVNTASDHVIGALGVGPMNNGGNIYGNVIFPMTGTVVGGVWGYGHLSPARHVTIPNLVNPSAYESPTLSRQWHARLQALSDGTAVIEHSRRVFQPEVAFPAAPWTTTLFPHATDSPEVRDKKLELAEAKYNMRRAEYGLQVQAHRRGWGDRPRAAVAENGVDISAPVFVRTISGRYFDSSDVPRQVLEALTAAGLPSSSVRTPKPFTVEINISGEQVDMIPRIITERLERAANYNPYEVSTQSNVMSHLAN